MHHAPCTKVGQVVGTGEFLASTMAALVSRLQQEGINSVSDLATTAAAAATDADAGTPSSSSSSSGRCVVRCA